MESALPFSGCETAVYQQNRIGAQALQHACSRHRHQRIIGDDHQVWISNNTAFKDLVVRSSHIGKDRGSPSFRPVAWGILDFKTFLEERCAQDAAGGFHALAAPSMKTDPVHVSSPLPRQ